MSLSVHATRLSLAVYLAMTATAVESQEWSFHVTADGRSIGTHIFKVSGAAADRNIETTATFKARALLIPVYHYEHHDRESWKGDCLQKIDADTDDDGKTNAVHGYADATGFHLSSGKTLPACIQTFAYWDEGFLKHSQLLNSQTGEFTSIHTTRIGMESITVLNQPVQAEHFRLQTPKFSIDLWYSNTGEWLALESLTENGHRLRYEKQ